MKYALRLLLISVVATTGCIGTYYHARDGIYGLGFSESRLGPDLWRVMYRGYYIPESQSFDYALLRASDVVLAAGYPFFTVESERTSSTVQAGAGMLAGSAGAAVMGGFPEAGILVRALRSKPKTSSGIVYDAAFISAEMRRKYKIKERG
jgi:hypothetical protein